MLLNESGKKNVAEKNMDHSLIILHTAINLHSKNQNVSYKKAREIITKKKKPLRKQTKPKKPKKNVEMTGRTEEKRAGKERRSRWKANH